MKLRKRGIGPDPLFMPSDHRRWHRTKIGKFFGALTDRMNWQTDWCPNWFEFFNALAANAILRITPWYRNRGRLINSFIQNCGKELDWGRSFALVRTRGENGEVNYYQLTCTLFRANVKRRRLLDDDGKTHNAFLTGIIGSEKPVEWHEETILRGWCCTERQCQKFLDECTSLTPDLYWFD